MKKCKHCGKTMNDGDLFCPRCAQEYRDDQYREKRSSSEVKKAFQEIEVNPTKKNLPQIDKKAMSYLSIGVAALMIVLLFPTLSPLLAVFALFTLSKKRR